MSVAGRAGAGTPGRRSVRRRSKHYVRPPTSSRATLLVTGLLANGNGVVRPVAVSVTGTFTPADGSPPETFTESDAKHVGAKTTSCSPDQGRWPTGYLPSWAFACVQAAL